MSSYWDDRVKQEKAWQQRQLENDQAFNDKLQVYYDQAINDINDTIEKELNRVGANKVSQMDVKAFETEAKSIVAEAEKMRANGQKVTYSDFSDKVNERLKVYNATMRINRLEHLKSEVGLDMLRAGIKVDSDLREKLSGDYQSEVIRQAGIMMDSAQRSALTGAKTAKTVMAQTNGATFSDRLWANQDALKAKLDQVLSTGLIQGQNARKMAVRLREQVRTAVNNQRYVTERLARTESARIQTTVQMDSIKKNGYNYVQWVAEPKACVGCRAIASRDSGFGEGVYKVDKVPRIPDDTHPNCRCSISPTWVENADDNLVGGKRSKTLDNLIAKETAKKVVKKLSDSELKEKYLSKSIVAMIGDKDSVELARRLDKAPDLIKTIWVNNTNKMKMLDYNASDRSFYTPSKHGVVMSVKHMNLSNDATYYQNKYDVFYHEFGHLIDGEALGPNKLVSRGLSFYIDQDFNELVEKQYAKTYGKELKIDFKMDGGKTGVLEDGRTIKLKKNGQPTVASIDKLKKYATKDLIKSIKKELRENGYGQQDTSDLSDIVGGTYLEDTFPFSVGHPKSYWRRVGAEGRDTEFFAEATSATINNPKSLGLIKKYFPTAYNEYLKRLDKYKE